MKDALVVHAKAVSIRLEVMPGSKVTAITGYDEWRKRIKVSLREPPKGGAANRELLEILSETLNVGTESLRITEGLRSRRKTVVVERMNQADVLDRLKRALG